MAASPGTNSHRFGFVKDDEARLAPRSLRMNYNPANENRVSANSLIEASRVRGSSVFNRTGEKLGSIDDIMIEKRSGKAVYAIMSFGGFLGIGEDYHPLPWSMLTYDPALGGYVVDLDRTVLEGAPAYAAGASPRWGDQTYEEGLHRYYGAPPYWDDTWM
jgi:sporulation protein YlmC with PRC-barrel domain